jgi:hypothetical protein
VERYRTADPRPHPDRAGRLDLVDVDDHPVDELGEVHRAADLRGELDEVRMRDRAQVERLQHLRAELRQPQAEPVAPVDAARQQPGVEHRREHPQRGRGVHPQPVGEDPECQRATAYVLQGAQRLRHGLGHRTSS